jgi:hypothetical protein
MLLVVFATALVYRSILSRVALAQFDQAQAALTRRHANPNVEVRGDAGVDVRLWSRERIGDYRKSLFMKIDPPLAVLHLDFLSASPRLINSAYMGAEVVRKRQSNPSVNERELMMKLKDERRAGGTERTSAEPGRSQARWLRNTKGAG